MQDMLRLAHDIEFVSSQKTDMHGSRALFVQINPL